MRESAWEKGFSYLKEFTDREGHAKVPNDFKTENGYRLGYWVSKQRAGRDNIFLERRSRLEALGYTGLLNNLFISPEHQARLEALTGWSWDTRESAWEEGFRYLNEFVDREGHAKVPKRYKAVDGYNLGNWVIAQRGIKDSLSSGRKARLNALSSWSWDARADSWEEGFYHLKEFVEREGHANASRDYKTAEGYRLGVWVRQQREKKDSLSSERIARLEALLGRAWNWGARADKWEEGFYHLKEFSKREGHPNASRDYKTAEGYRLGVWVRQQREKKDSLSSERIARLEALLGWTWIWDTRADKWEEGFYHLKEFSKREGHANVSRDCKTAEGYRLGAWVREQQMTKNSMSPERKARLKALPLWALPIIKRSTAYSEN